MASPSQSKTKINNNAALPRWTKRVVTEMTGRDPLGLSRVISIITDYLLTGIITQTDRARYYSFYCWALWHIEKEDRPQKYEIFVDGFRRREAALALATVENNPQTSPVGILATKPHLMKGKETGLVNCDFRVLPSNPLGGYGQYYSGSMYELGLTYRPEDGVDRVTQYGQIIAELFHTSIKNTSYIKKELFRERSFSVTEIRNFSKYLTLDALFDSSTNLERAKLTEMFLSLGERPLGDRDVLRKHTLIQILNTVSEYETLGIVSNVNDVDNFLVYPVYYYNVLHLNRKALKTYQPPDSFAICSSLWKQFCLQQFLCIGLEFILKSVLDILSHETSGLTSAELISSLITRDFFSDLKNLVGKTCATPNSLLKNLAITDVPDEIESLKFVETINYKHPLSEINLLRKLWDQPGSSLFLSLTLIAVIFSKWRGITNDVGLKYVANNAGTELWSGTLIPYLDRWLVSEVTWEQAATELIEIFVLNQHDRIMYQKRRLDSCWLHRSEGRIQKDQDYRPALRSSRHWNCVRILQDLGFLEINDKGDMSLTSDGKRILQKSLSVE